MSLLSLPFEVRRQIYTHLFAGSCIKITIRQLHHDCHISSTTAVSLPLAMTLVSRQVQTESLPLLLSNINLVVVMTGSLQKFDIATQTVLPTSLLENIETLTLHYWGTVKTWVFTNPVLRSLKRVNIEWTHDWGSVYLMPTKRTLRACLAQEGDEVQTLVTGDTRQDTNAMRPLVRKIKEGLVEDEAITQECADLLDGITGRQGPARLQVVWKDLFQVTFENEGENTVLGNECGGPIHMSAMFDWHTEELLDNVQAVRGLLADLLRPQSPSFEGHWAELSENS